MPTAAAKLKEGAKQEPAAKGKKPLDAKLVLKLLEEGQSRKQVADKLGTSQFQVDRIRTAAGIKQPQANKAKKRATKKRR